MMDGVTLTPGKEMIVGPTTDVIAGEKMIVTAGGVDTHIHFICPQQIDEAIASGVTTMYGGGTGPSAGTSATSKCQMMSSSSNKDIHYSSHCLPC